MSIPIEKVNSIHWVLIAIGTLMGMYFMGCTHHTLIDNPVARMGSASAIKDKLATTQALRGTNIEVNIHDGKNILSGVVYTKKQKFLAGSVARSVQGSGIVVNQLVVR